MTTLTVLRRALLPVIGTYDQGTASSSTTNNTTTQLECLADPFQSSVLDEGYWTDKWLYRPAAAVSTDKQRIISGATPASGLLSISVPNWTNKPTSEAFEVVGGPVGPTTANEIINDALLNTYVEAEFTFTVASNLTREHDLTTIQSWLKHDWMVRAVGVLTSGQSRTNYNPFSVVRHGQVITRNGIVYLQDVSFATTDTVYVLAVKPAYYHCKPSAGAYGDQSGLSLESDEAPVDEGWLKWKAVELVCDRLDETLGVQGSGDVDRMRAKAVARFGQLTPQNFQMPSLTFRPVVWMGPARVGRRW